MRLRSLAERIGRRNRNAKPRLLDGTVELGELARSGLGVVRLYAELASRLRFRPILMRSFAFILGVLPLVWARGAAAASRQSLGTAVFGGMITSTVLAVFFVPVFYVAIQGLIELCSGPPKMKGVKPALAFDSPDGAQPGVS